MIAFPFSILPVVAMDGSQIFQSILVSELNSNPTMSKDMLNIIKSGMLYVKRTVRPSRANNNDYSLKLGSKGIY